ncbi:MAG: SpoIIE family protein phosphatase [Verrucomicrobia bacterium]|nr:SpoIIE family protein phosphatase [Verrucomicrobiota bacterium]
MNKPIRVLVVEDSEYDTLLLVYELRRGAFDPMFQRVDTPATMSAALDQQTWDIVVADFSMPQFNALAALELLKKKGLDVPFIIVSGTIGEEVAVAAMKNGAQDYIMKNNLNRLVPAVERELREAVARRKRTRAEAELRENKEQFRVAREIQQRLFPKAAPQFGPFDLAGGSYPAEATGGDYFDYLPLADGGLGVVVADVTGHGVGPALLMAETRAYLRTLTMNDTDVGEILTRANRLLADDVDCEHYVTLILAKLDPLSQSLVYASAGHPNGYVLDASGKPKALLQRTGVPLGLQPGGPYIAAPPIRLLAGDIVVLVTDGIEESLSPENDFFGRQRIFEVARDHAKESAREILEALFGAVRNFSQGRPQLDDLTVVVAKVSPSP